MAVTQRRTIKDFSHKMRWLVDEAYPDSVGCLILDNPFLCRVRGSEHPPRDVAVRDIPSGRGPTDGETDGIPLHTQAWE